MLAASLGLVARIMPGLPLIGWPTPDGSMPFHLFLALLAALPTVVAQTTLIDLRVPLIARGDAQAERLLAEVQMQASG